MTLGIDSTYTGTTGGSAVTSLGFYVTVSAARKSVALLACVSLRAQSGSTLSSITATYNGVSMSPVTSLYDSGGNNGGVAIFILEKPSVGTNTLTFSWSGGSLGDGYCAVLYGANLGNLVRGYATYAYGAGLSQSIGSLSGDYIFDVVCNYDSFGGSGTLVPGASQAQILSSAHQLSNRMLSGGSYRAGQHSSTTMSWNGIIAWAIVCIRPGIGDGGVAVSPSLLF